MEKNGTFILKNEKERIVPNGKECSVQPWLQGLDFNKGQNILIFCMNCFHSTTANVLKCSCKQGFICKKGGNKVKKFRQEFQPAGPS